MYEFVQKLAKKKKETRLSFQPGTNMACNRRVPFIYIPYNKITIRKMRLYKFIRVTYSHPLLALHLSTIWSHVRTHVQCRPMVKAPSYQILFLPAVPQQARTDGVSPLCSCYAGSLKISLHSKWSNVRAPIWSVTGFSVPATSQSQGVLRSMTTHFWSLETWASLLAGILGCNIGQPCVDCIASISYIHSSGGTHDTRPVSIEFSIVHYFPSSMCSNCFCWRISHVPIGHLATSPSILNCNPKDY